MDKIFIKGLKVYANHGVHNEEKLLGQNFILDVTMNLNLKNACKTDSINETVSYSSVAKKITETMKSEVFNLIETAGSRVAETILKEFSLVESVTVLVKKPSAPIKIPLDFVAVEINRSKGVFL